MDGPRNRGRLVVSRSAAVVQRAAMEMPVVKDGLHFAEINLQSLELKVCHHIYEIPLAREHIFINIFFLLCMPFDGKHLKRHIHLSFDIV